MQPVGTKMPQGQPVEEEMLAQGVREGWITAPKRRLTTAPPNVPLMKLADLLADLEEARADRDLPR